MEEKRDNIQAEITALKDLLAQSDHISNQIIESLLTEMRDASALNCIGKLIAWLAASVTEYGDILRSRAAWRAKLRQLEAELEEEGKNEMI